MYDILNQRFKVGDVIGSNADGARIVIKVDLIGGHWHYTTLRTDPEDIRVNGKTAKYTQASLSGWKWLRYEPSVEVLYGRS